MSSNRLDSIFNELRASKRKGLMPFVCGCSPRPGDTRLSLLAMQRAGASVVEVGYPFSDPIADGPVIAAAMHEALKNGATPALVHAEIAQARREGLSIGVVAMVSVSMVHRVGRTKFFGDLAASGVDGLILPDVGVEDAIAGGWLEDAGSVGLAVSLLVAPATSLERARAIVSACSGFVYVLARAGITGDQAGSGKAATAQGNDGGLRERLAMLRTITTLPLAVGFGVSTAEDVRRVVIDADADAAIVGSALVKRMCAAAESGGDPINTAAAFAAELSHGLTRA